ncbi:hydroxymethylpyrimidine pyrophosphatase-like HAD family hydrolase [Cytobacillus oceanisediminis]|uniref:Hydroxymethylpyrimidine pyrophosphatase-like HAD family hydrolase n=2 Tax=Cytobacillus oceanisediminis TaxID=665099 RepID=A0A2V3A0L0_9BACI|nr:hydroxymethylpyrimidine pyrophosphatase-like HAD family hydrolase [Cytobacillus oceanisediminis]
MIMFASDLDRTLIYSDRALADLGHPGRGSLVGVERKDGQEIAFMTKQAHGKLKEICSQMLFVPVTTRTYEQFNRVFIFQEDIPVPYAITSNGANIHFHGNPMEEWAAIVRDRLKTECAIFEDMVEKTKGYELNGTLKAADNLFFYYILSEKITSEAKGILSSMAESFGWKVSLQGRKLYFMPNPICKGEAVKFIKDREGISSVYGAGDSVLDHDFLQFCDYPYVPNHGELVKYSSLCLPYKISKNRGVKAGEEILADILNNIKQKI